MRQLLSILAALCLLAAPAAAQTLKALSFNTSNGVVVANTGTNKLTFNDDVRFAQGDFVIGASGAVLWQGDIAFEIENKTLYGPWNFDEPGAVRTNIGLGATNSPTLAGLTVTNLGSSGASSVVFAEDTGLLYAMSYGATLTNLGISSNNAVSFANVSIGQTTPTNGLLFIRRTNNEPFLGLANLIASNNTTISNETLFRVGVAEATNRAAQFGFRSTNTNGNGVAVFSVFGFNALMMIGADALTNAVIYSGGGTNNEVMTLIRDGATEFARPLRFSTNASTRPATNAPANTTNVAAWVEMRIGTNSYRVQLFQ